MSKITKFDKKNLEQVRAKINAALASVEQELGVKIDLGNIRFNDTSFRSELNVVLVNATTANPDLADVPAKYISDLIRKYKDQAVGKKVEINGDPATIVGLRGQSFIFKYADGTPGAKRSPGLRKIAIAPYSKLDCQVRGVEFDQHLYDAYNR